ncbi:hypothetical protein BDA96_08G073800 [Sorghum bicolor]|uniref:Uncharacterized protein n=1 Tax=Sorghum bicolor TaxID=4558 RepID=A0A921QEX8_SORBI|nr:hypothetical protein BDA96_08G073800 [Sorghum bicolor]
MPSQILISSPRSSSPLSLSLTLSRPQGAAPPASRPASRAPSSELARLPPPRCVPPTLRPSEGAPASEAPLLRRADSPPLLAQLLRHKEGAFSPAAASIATAGPPPPHQHQPNRADRDTGD